MQQSSQEFQPSSSDNPDSDEEEVYGEKPSHSAKTTLQLYANAPDHPPPTKIAISDDTNPLCPFCEHIVNALPFAKHSSNTEKSFSEFPHYNNYIGLQASVDSGCIICAQLLFSWKRRAIWDGLAFGFNHQETTALLDFSCNTVIDGRDHSWKIELCDASGMTKFSAEVYVKHASSRVPPQSIESMTSTQDALPIAREWFKHCSATHSSCHSNHRPDNFAPVSHSSTPNSNPTRLIELCPPKLAGLTERSVRLCLGSKLPPVKFATLSHSWGKTEFPTLLHSNISSFLNHIPANALTNTFQDAIAIARSLNLQYLWIDSLCIIQDSASDWAVESALMRSVYGRSEINIAASGAADGSFGCFFSSAAGEWKAQFQHSFGRSEHLFDCFDTAFARQLLDMPLSSRGWVVQERILPRRTLHFTKTELFWECSERRACGAFPDRLPLEVDKLLEVNKRPPEMTIGMNTGLWEDWVKLYSGCELTFAKDKLVAIQGLADLVERKKGKRYLGGLFEEGLPGQLCWNVGDPESHPPRRHRPVEPRPPSWSWISVDGPVYFPKHEYDWQGTYSVIEYISSRTAEGPWCVSGDYFAGLEVTCKYLSRGVLKRYSEERWHRNRIIISEEHYLDLIELDCLPEESSEDGGIDVDIDGRSDAFETLAVHVLPVVSDRAMRCMILRASGRRGEYRRIGMAYGETEVLLAAFLAIDSRASVLEFVDPGFNTESRQNIVII